MILVVIDTNVVVSALLQPDGLPAAVLMLALSGRVQPCVSEVVLGEYEDVIRRPRFKRDAESIEGTLQAIRKVAQYVKPIAHVDACSDPDDNMFLECAEVAHANYLVMGNLRHFPPRWKKTRVIGVREFIGIFVRDEG